MKFAVVFSLFAVFAVSAIQGAAVESNDVAPETPVAEDGFNPFGFIIDGVKNFFSSDKAQPNQMQEMIEKIKVLAEKQPEAARLINEVRSNPLSVFNHIDEIMALLQEVGGEESAKETVAAPVEEETAVEDVKPETQAVDGKKQNFNPIQAVKNSLKDLDERRRKLGQIWNEFVKNPATLAKNIDEIMAQLEFGKSVVANGLKASKAIRDFSCNPLSIANNFDDIVEMLTGRKPDPITLDDNSAVQIAAERGFRAYNILMEMRCNPFSLFSNFDEIAQLVDEMVPDSEPGKKDNPLQMIANTITNLAERKMEATVIFEKMRANPVQAMQYVDDMVRVLMG